MKMPRWAKLLGVAGIAGVAATGVVLVRAERRRRAYTPDEIRTRLHERHAEAHDEVAELQVAAQGRQSADLTRHHQGFDLAL